MSAFTLPRVPNARRGLTRQIGGCYIVPSHAARVRAALDPSVHPLLFGAIIVAVVLLMGPPGIIQADERLIEAYLGR
jgi:hypothetical protein